MIATVRKVLDLDSYRHVDRLFSQSDPDHFSQELARRVGMARSNAASGVRRPFFVMGLYAVLESCALILASLAVALAYYTAAEYQTPPELIKRYLGASALIVLIYLLFQQGNHLFAPERLSEIRPRFLSALRCWTLAFAVALLAAFSVKMSDDYSRAWLFLYFGTGCGVILAGHAILRVLRSKLFAVGNIGERVAILCLTDTAHEMVERVMKDRSGLFRLVGLYDDRGSRAHPHLAQAPRHGMMDDLVSDIRKGLVDTVLVCLPWDAQQRLDHIMKRLTEVSVNVNWVPPLQGSERYDPKHTVVSRRAVLALSLRPIDNWSAVAKWIFDRGLAVIALALLMPLLLATCVAIKLDSAGPILFRQRRFGLNNQPFEMLKFRTMHVHSQDVSGAQRTVRNDARITRLGVYLRRFSIDELPQLWNVLRGDMSIVGPRAHAISMRVGERYYHDAVSEYLTRHRVKPGITGWAQVNGSRGEVDTLEKAHNRVELDLYYIRNWSLSLDLSIIGRTVVQLFTSKQAY
jgi:polysaccharide biosynthesis protein PslA